MFSCKAKNRLLYENGNIKGQLVHIDNEAGSEKFAQTSNKYDTYNNIYYYYYYGIIIIIMVLLLFHSITAQGLLASRPLVRKRGGKLPSQFKTDDLSAYRVPSRC